MRFSRESVCTAFTPPSFLSTYIVCNSGWSKPVWNLLATIRNRTGAQSLRGLRFREAVHIGLGVRLPAVLDGSQKATSAWNG